MQKKRVLYIHTGGSLGGSAISLFKLVEHLNRSLYEPVVLFYDASFPYATRFESLGAKVITLNKELSPKKTGLEQIRLGNRLERYSRKAAQVYRFFKSVYRLLRGDLVRARRIKQIITDNRIDLVHHNNQWNQAAVIAARLAGVPQICHMRALAKVGPVDRWLLQSVNTFIYVSKAIASYYEEQGLPAHKGRVILNGVSLAEFTAAQETETLRQELGLQATDILVGNIGRLVWWKGYEFFLKAVAELLPSFPNLKALIVGETDDMPRNLAYKESLRALTQSLGLSEVVIFTGFRADIPRIMAALDIIVHSATELEPGGRILIEALASGTPLVASKAGGILDIAEDGVHALLIPPGDAHAIAGAVKRLLANPQLAQRLSEAGRCRVLECCTVERYAHSVQQLYAVQFTELTSELREAQEFKWG